MIRMVAHNLKITAILKLQKLVLCPLSPLRHNLRVEGGLLFCPRTSGHRVLSQLADEGQDE